MSEFEKLLKAADLSGVQLTHCRAQLEDSGAPETFSFELESATRVPDGAGDNKLEFRFRNSFSIKGDGDLALFSLEATWEIEFDLNGEHVDSGEVVRKEFLEKVATPVIWPYLREFIQSTSARFGFTEVTLPLNKNVSHIVVQ